MSIYIIFPYCYLSVLHPHTRTHTRLVTVTGRWAGWEGGVDGMDGMDGVDGLDGLDGVDGEDGLDGMYE